MTPDPTIRPRLDVTDEQARAAIGKLLEGELQGDSIDVPLGPYESWLIMQALQLSVTYPEMGDQVAEAMTRLGRRFQVLFEASPVLSELAERGWERDHDVTRRSGHEVDHG